MLPIRPRFTGFFPLSKNALHPACAPHIPRPKVMPRRNAERATMTTQSNIQSNTGNGNQNNNQNEKGNDMKCSMSLAPQFSGKAITAMVFGYLAMVTMILIMPANSFQSTAFGLRPPGRRCFGPDRSGRDSYGPGPSRSLHHHRAG